ncbi:MAG: hypothetical protein JW795_23575 [Chitinivibrionales bacterium]|nr:hypothetical protein [Chitinivibrionales bacterium]
METIGITIWDTLVSPLYDASCFLLIVRPDNTRLIADITELSLSSKAAFCEREGVCILICGAISRTGLISLRDRAIQVLSWVHGPVEDVVNAYLNGANLYDNYAMPGCTMRRCGRRGNQRKRRREQYGF